MGVKKSTRASETPAPKWPSLTARLPFFTDGDNRLDRQLGWGLGHAKSCQGAHAAGELCAKAYLKHRGDAHPTTDLKRIAELLCGGQIGRYGGAFAFGFFSELDSYLTYAGAVLQKLGKQKDDTFESIAAGVRNRIELTEAQFMKEQRSKTSKQAWARKRSHPARTKEIRP